MKLSIQLTLLVLAIPGYGLAQDNEMLESEQETTNQEVGEIDGERGIEVMAAVGDNEAEETSIVEDTVNELEAFFDVPTQTNQGLDLATQQQLLEQYQTFAMKFREVKEQGNEDLILALLRSFTDSTEFVDLFQNAMGTIAVSNAEPVNRVIVESAEAEQVSVQPTRHRLVPVLAQVYSERGRTDKAIIEIDGFRYIRVPGETIEHEDRSILLESIEQNRVNGRDVYTIWIVENGAKESLLWN